LLFLGVPESAQTILDGKYWKGSLRSTPALSSGSWSSSNLVGIVLDIDLLSRSDAYAVIRTLPSIAEAIAGDPVVPESQRSAGRGA